MEFNARMRPGADEALLDLLVPFWQMVIGVVVVGVTVLATHKLLMRGPSRMSRAIVLTGGAVLGLLLLGIVLTIL
jgi:hypothetical protein